MKFSINISTGNAALADDPAGELAVILDNVKEKLSEGIGYLGSAEPFSGRIRDSNGNNIGSWEFDPNH